MRIRKINIAIVGAGIGGLATASLLAQAGHRVMLFDQYERPRPVGSGLMIQPLGLAVLDACGAGDAARKSGQRIGRMLGLEVTRGRRILDVTYDMENRAERQGLAIHRAALHEALLAAAMRRGVQITTKAEVRAAPVTGHKRMVALPDGSQSGPYDLVVDASGAGSALSPLQARALPYGAIWGTVPWPDDSDLPTDQLTQRYLRASHMAGVLPLGHVPGRRGLHAAVFWSMPRAKLASWAECDISDWRAEAAALWPDFAPFARSVTAVEQMTPAQYAHGTLRCPHAPALAFIGDAAHRASPQLGQGANMALFDALALARALDRAPVADALPLYADMRRWHVRLYQGMSAAFTPQYQSDSRVLPALRDWLLAPLSLTPPMRPILSRIVAGTLLHPLAGEDFQTVT